MRRLGLAILIAAALGALAAAPAQAAFGLSHFDATFEEEGGGPATKAGSHPYATPTTFLLNFHEEEEAGKFSPDEELKDVEIAQPLGLAGNPKATPRCAQADFFTFNPLTELPSCPDNTAVGSVRPQFSSPGQGEPRPLYNLTPAPGVAAQIGFMVGQLPVVIDLTVSKKAPYRVIATSTNTAQALKVYGAEVTVWGNPESPVHDEERGVCIFHPGTECSAEGAPEKPFLTLPRACAPPLFADYSILSWQHPEATPLTGSSETPLEVSGCEELGFDPEAKAQPSSAEAESPSGLGFEVDVEDPGLTEPEGTAKADIRSIEVKLPEGMSANPAAAEGLAACTKAELEAVTMAAGSGCPEASKLGTVEVETPLLEGEVLEGSLYLASQADNPFGSLLAFYVVIKDPELGILITQPAKVTLDPQTGQITTTVEEMPQLPFSHLRLHLASGPRAPLTTPAACGKYDIQTTLIPYNNRPPVVDHSSFEVTSGPGGGPCPPSPGPFAPGFSAGTLHNAAATYSPFLARLTREPGTSPLTGLTIALPPGLTGKLAGIPYCTEAQIAQAIGRAAPGQGALELQSPSCPAASQIGTVLSGAGAGSALTYVPGRVYLAGPYEGAPLSAVAIVPAVAGPFDLGTVVVRNALRVDLETAQVSTVSDPLPHILAGIPLELRDLRIVLERPGFTLNPSSCEAMAIGATALSLAGQSAALSAPFQAGGCNALSFKPKLSISLEGKTKRTGHPALRAELKMLPGGANIARAQVGLPHALFLDQGNLNKVCTQPELKSASCPASSVYGRARAWSPLLDQPLEGNVYLGVGYGHKLPDLVAELNGQIRVLLHARIDTTKQDGLRSTFEVVPDAPVSRFVLEMKGGRKYGLLENHEDLCVKLRLAAARFAAHNGRLVQLRPRIATGCPRHKSKHRR